MVRSDEFFQLIIDLEDTSPWCYQSKYQSMYGITQPALNTYNYKHTHPMERVIDISKQKAKDIFLEFYYLPVKSIINPEKHFNYMDVYYSHGQKSYQTMLESSENIFTIESIYKWREGNFMGKKERLDKIKMYFKQR